jgi:hypothetical protein
MEITFHTQLPSGHACQYGVDSKEGENKEEVANSCDETREEGETESFV